ncbi:MAG: anthranilate phosphoribosyltransferase [Negativicutes bacterium]|nr:anthranilate phosphoribosyltransferase [Negativicutes bacterium]
MLKGYLRQLIAGRHLSREEAGQAMDAIMSGQASEVQIGSFLTAMQMKGLASAEITGFADTMRRHSLPIACDREDLMDTCGTGGDGKGTFNISTTAAFVLAGAGLAIAKHGNRGISSSCGSADVLTALGIRVDLPPGAVAQIINQSGIGFLYAPAFHQAMKYVANPRKELGFRTVFNVLGPLTNPLRASRQLVGVYDGQLVPRMAEALAGLGVKRAMVVHSLDGMDEISTAAPTQVVEVDNGILQSYLINPAEYGFAACCQKAYQGGAPEDNAQITLAILRGEQGPRSDVVLLNAAAALVVGEKAENMREGLMLAQKSIDSGAALAKLEELRDLSQRVHGEGLVC